MNFLADWNSLKSRILLVIILITLAIFCLYYLLPPKNHCVYAGKVSLGEATGSAQVISLDGQWEFYWAKLLTPEDFAASRVPPPELVSVPDNWQKHAHDNLHSRRGFATYRVIISGLTPQRHYGLIKKNIRVASRMYINGELALEDGIVADNKTDAVMGNSPQVVFFQSDDSSAEIIIQVSNFRYYSGGIVEAIRFGPGNEVFQEHNRKTIFEAIVFAMLLSIGLLHIVLAFLIPGYYKKEPAVLYLPVTVVMLAIINGTLSQRVIKLLFPHLSTELLIRIEYIAVGLLLIAMFGAINLMDERLLPKKISRALLVIFGIFTIGVMFVPLNYPLMWISFTLYTSAVLFLVFLWVLGQYLFNCNLRISSGEHVFLIAVLYIINIYNIDLLIFTIGFKDDMNLALISAVFFGVAWLLLMVYRYNLAYGKNLELSGLLQENCNSLELVSEMAKRSEMAFLQAQIKPHFLFNALSSIIGLLPGDPTRAKGLLQNLAAYLKRLFAVDLSVENITLASELETIYAYVNIELERFAQRLTVEFAIDETALTAKLLPLLVQPLVENGIQHGALKREGQGIVRLTIRNESDGLFILVEDNGPGFSPRVMAALASCDAPADKSASAGIGVVNIKHRLRLYYNELLHIETGETGGAKICFKIPYVEGARNVTVSDCR